MIIRNLLSRTIAALRKSRRLQPFHRRYGPIKYKYTLPAYRRIVAWLSPGTETEYGSRNSYAEWAAQCEALRYDRNRVIERIKAFEYTPVVSIILPVYNTQTDLLHKAIDSVINQYYPYWELCICDDASSAGHVRKLLEQYRDGDARIKVAFSDTNAGIGAASNRALSFATGEFIGLFDHDDELTPDAIFEVAATLQQTDADLIYSDEDRLDEKERREDPAFKPAWSPDLLLSRMYLGHFCVYRKSIVDRIGGFRSDFDGSQDYDLALRVTEVTSKIAHIPKILYHWRKVSSSASGLAAARNSVTDAGRRALIDALRRRMIDGVVENQTIYGLYRVKRNIGSNGLVSIIIPTRDGVKHLSRCVGSIEAKTNYRNYEILIIDNGSASATTLDYLKRTPHRVIRLDEPFNFSRLNNIAVQQARGDYVLFLNDDTTVISDEWLTAMLEHAKRPEVGAVGAKLLYRDGRIQHAGIILGVGGTASHAHRGVDGFSAAGYLNNPSAICNYNAVTAACLMMRREVFLGVGGFDEQALPVSFNDVDLCLRLRNRGYRIVYTPYAMLYHDESATRGKNRYPTEEAILRARWPSELTSDWYYNPNLSGAGDFTVDVSKPESVVSKIGQEVADVVLCHLGTTTNVGQDFFTDDDNLCAIAIRLEPNGPGADCTVRLRLRESAESEADLASSDVPVSQLRSGQWSFFAFDCMRQSRGQQLYFFLELHGESIATSLKVLGRPPGTEEIGRHFENHIAVPGTLAFRVHTVVQFRYAEPLPEPGKQTLPRGTRASV
jgi:O-antigen biosynthesis protein